MRMQPISQLAEHLQIDASESSQFPGFAAATLQSDGTVNFSVLGYSNLATSIRIDEDTQFHSASIAKCVTSYLICDLARRGLIGLDDCALHHAGPEWSFSSEITVSHLLNHRSGLHDFWPYSMLAGHRSGDPVKTADIIAIMRSVNTTNFTPGSEYLYCNTGYLILAEIIERQTGKSIAEIAKQWLFEPLGMHKTFFAENPLESFVNAAVAYELDGSSFVLNNANYAVPGPTSLISSVKDLMILSSHYIDGRDPTVKFLLEENQHWYNFGFGYSNGHFRFRNENSIDLVGHGGADWGFFSSWFTNLETREAAAVLSNMTNKLAEQASFRSLTEEWIAPQPDPSRLKTRGRLGSPTVFKSPAGYIDLSPNKNSLSSVYLGGMTFVWDPVQRVYKMPGYAGWIEISTQLEGQAHWISPFGEFFLEAEGNIQKKIESSSPHPTGKYQIENTTLFALISKHAEGISIEICGHSYFFNPICTNVFVRSGARLEFNVESEKYMLSFFRSRDIKLNKWGS